MAEKKFLDYDGLQELVLKIKEYIGDAGKLEFKGVVADVAHLPTLSEQKVGWMYTVTAKGKTTNDFTDGAGKEVAANSEVAAVKVEGEVTNPVWSIDGGTSYVNSSLEAYVPAGTLGSATKLCSGYVATAEDTDLDLGALYVTNDDGTSFYKVTALGDTFADFTKVAVEAGAAFDALTAKIASFVDVNVYTETKTLEGMKWCLIGPVFDVSDKLTFGEAMPSNPADGDTFLYMGETSYTYDAVTPTGDENPKALGWYESDGEGGYQLTEDETVDSGKTYYTKNEEYVKGVIYKYDESEAKWLSQSSGDTFQAITNEEIDALFM